jgi:hypothetical protein
MVPRAVEKSIQWIHPPATHGKITGPERLSPIKNFIRPLADRVS